VRGQDFTGARRHVLMKGYGSRIKAQERRLLLEVVQKQSGLVRNALEGQRLYAQRRLFRCAETSW
jgi:hypothetical protein